MVVPVTGETSSIWSPAPRPSATVNGVGTVAELHPLRSGFGAAAAFLALLALLLALRAPGGVNPLDQPTVASIAEAPLSFEPAQGRFGRGCRFSSPARSPAAAFTWGPERRAGRRRPPGTRTLRLEVPRRRPGGGAGPARRAPRQGEQLHRRRPLPLAHRDSYLGAVRYRSIYPGVDRRLLRRPERPRVRLPPRAGRRPGRVARRASTAPTRWDRHRGATSRSTSAGDRAPARAGRLPAVGGERHLVDAAFDLRGTTLGFRLGAYDHSRHAGDRPRPHLLHLSRRLARRRHRRRRVDAKAPPTSPAAPTPPISRSRTTYSGPGANGCLRDQVRPGRRRRPVALAYSTYLGASRHRLSAARSRSTPRAPPMSAGITASKNFPTVDPLARPGGRRPGQLRRLRGQAQPRRRGDGGDRVLDLPFRLDQRVRRAHRRRREGAAYVTGEHRLAPTSRLQTTSRATRKTATASSIQARPRRRRAGDRSPTRPTWAATPRTRSTDLCDARVYIAGYTDGTHFPTQDPFETDDGGFDALAIKVFPSYTGVPVALAYSTYLGGAKGDFADRHRGRTGRERRPLSARQSPATSRKVLAFESDQAGDDAFVTEIAPDGGGPVALSYSTYLGGGLATRHREWRSTPRAMPS